MNENEGILIGCDERQEWLLKWWWNHYSKTNSYPVTFLDYGLTPCAKSWCQSKGHVISSLPPDWISNQETISEQASWAKNVPLYVWNHRPVWFTKAFSLFETPYEKTIWIDLDCEVKKNLSPLFHYAEYGDGFAITTDAPDYVQHFKEIKALHPEAVGMQVGVFAFRCNSPVLDAWLKHCYENHDQEFSEQTALSHVLYHHAFKTYDITSEYNWLYPENPNPDAAIVHHTGASRKRKLMLEAL